MKTFLLAFNLLMILLLASCATLDKSECRKADWQVIGLEDGAKGHPISYIGNHRKACAEYGVKPDLNQYRLGHQAGLGQFCTASNGFKLGRAGRGFSDVCPVALRNQFLGGYDTGRELYELNSQIDHMLQDAETKKAELSELNGRADNIETAIVSAAISSTDRKALIKQFKKMQTRITTLKTDIRDLELDAASMQGEFDVLNSSHGFY